MTGSRRARWRERWAQPATDRRRTAYRASLAQWRRRDAELRRQLTTATTTQPARDGDWSAWLDLAHGEAVYWTASGAGMVEAPSVLRLRPPHYREFGRADEPVAGAPIDTGQIAVTDQRVVFIGRTRRMWAYANLIGMAHTVAGQTWLLVTAGANISGVAPPSPAVAEFRLHLALALADRAGERDAFVAELTEQVERHQLAKPKPPASATAGQAPHWAQWGRRGRRLTAAALLSLFVVGTALAGDEGRPGSSSASTAAPAVPTPPPAATPGSPTPGTGSPPAPRGEPVRHAVPPRRLPPPPPPPPPSPSPTSPPSSSSPPPSPSPSADPVDPWFPNCDEANEHGYGPYHHDRDREYYWYRDRNRDGVVCEP